MVDASSKFQDSLPISSDELLKTLDQWNIKYNLFEHVPLRTVEDSKKVQGIFISSENGGGHVKNLYLRDKKKRNILLVAQQDQTVDLKKLSKSLGFSNLSFGSPERLMQHLGVRPGSVTPLSMITGVKNDVSLFLDKNLKSKSVIYIHPLVNDRTIEMTIENLEKFFSKVGICYMWTDL
ncbi:prolyl-tRNA synthetase associated domain-containing protein [Amylibacter sp.]|jgi:Ala-tRNA(Pro) deacylase|nr:prolyl-tRNA synthetase associated domain-containing protein [Amylibacter sp.]MDB2517429.1 prolyl-tRNA synthetase associated domain-containing protein [Amylibacter sp.]MDB2650672.1 prolyl-tRNA synthetase associated domain-containing protein [Amylibacter sp.]